MAFPRKSRLVTTLLVAGAAAAGLGSIAAACADDPRRRTSPEQALGGGGACEAPPGELPAADCDDSDKDCRARPGCTIDEARCGSASTCLPMADNTGKDILDYRIRRLNIAAPAALAASFIQNTIVGLNIDLEAQACGELGKGLFTWLLRVDRARGEIVTGGAPPSSDPFGLGFCFAAFEVGGNKVEPIRVKAEFEGDTFRSTEPKPINIPIFLADDIASAILLPIRDARLENVTLSAEGNCIGRFNQAALDPGCYDDREACAKWTTAGALGGYITLEEADAVLIRDLNNKSLCSFLAGESGLTCERVDGKIAYQGDYCGADKQAGSCRDSVWMAATFAASAVTIFDGAGTVEACSGASAEPEQDAGTDADVPEAGDGG
jgi:hypothetical protein